MRAGKPWLPAQGKALMRAGWMEFSSSTSLLPNSQCALVSRRDKLPRR